MPLGQGSLNHVTDTHVWINLATQVAFITNLLQALTWQINKISLLSVSWQFLIQWIKLGRKTAQKHKGNKSRGGVEGKEEELKKRNYCIGSGILWSYATALARFSKLYHLLRVMSGKLLSWSPPLQLAPKDKIRPAFIMKPIIVLTNNNGQYFKHCGYLRKFQLELH